MSTRYVRLEIQTTPSGKRCSKVRYKKCPFHSDDDNGRGPYCWLHTGYPDDLGPNGHTRTADCLAAEAAAKGGA